MRYISLHPKPVCWKLRLFYLTVWPISLEHIQCRFRATLDQTPPCTESENCQIQIDIAFRKVDAGKNLAGCLLSKHNKKGCKPIA